MKQEDIVALAKAGFTRDQIVALAGLQTAPAPQTAPVPQTAGPGVIGFIAKFC